MTTYALDSAFSFPDPKLAASIGYSVYIRYLARVSSQTAPKIWTGEQIRRCHDAGMSVGAVFEQQAMDPLKGEQRGKDDIRIGESQWYSLGAPKGTVIAVAYDFDANPDTVRPYAEGVRGDSSGEYPIMAYCSDAVAVKFFQWGLIDYFWQTESSGFGGTWPSPRAHIIQHTWYDLRPKMNADYDENVLHPEVGVVPWWGVAAPIGDQEDDVTTVLAGTTEIIPLKGKVGRTLLAVDGPSAVRVVICDAKGNPRYISKGDVETLGIRSLTSKDFAATDAWVSVHVYDKGEPLSNGTDAGGTGRPVGVTVSY